LSQAEKKKGPVCSQNDLKANTITNKNLVPKVNDTGFWFTNSRSHPKAFFGLKCSLSLIKIVYTEMNVSYLRYEDLLYQILFLCNKTF